MIADDRGSQIADRRKFCDRLRSYGNTLLRSPVILRSRSSAIVCEHLRSFAILRSYETKVLRSAIEMYPIIFLILTDDSTFLSPNVRWLALNIVARYECIYNRNSKNFKDKHKKSNSWEKVHEKFNLSCLFMNIFRILRF